MKQVMNEVKSDAEVVFNFSEREPEWPVAVLAQDKQEVFFDPPAPPVACLEWHRWEPQNRWMTLLKRLRHC